jgi:hypothetical protein
MSARSVNGKSYVRKGNINWGVTISKAVLTSEGMTEGFCNLASSKDQVYYSGKWGRGGLKYMQISTS